MVSLPHFLSTHLQVAPHLISTEQIKFLLSKTFFLWDSWEQIIPFYIRYGKTYTSPAQNVIVQDSALRFKVFGFKVVCLCGGQHPT